MTRAAHASDQSPLVLVRGSGHLAEAVAHQLALHHATLVRDGDRYDPATLDAALLCDDDDPANIAAALALREMSPSVRIVMRSFNNRIRSRLPELLGDCVVLSASRIAAPALCDLAVGVGGPGQGPLRRNGLQRLADRARGSQIAAVLRQLLRRSATRWLVGAMLLLTVAQALVARAAFGHDVEESLHVGLSSLVTFGFSDVGLAGVELASQPPWLQACAVATMLLDVVLVTALLGLIADALISERFARVFGGSFRRMRGHVVIAGLGSVGFRVLRELVERGYRCAVIEVDEDGPFVQGARRLGAHVVIADVRQDDEFAQLCIERAVAVLAVTDDDTANLEAAFTAMDLAPDVPVVVRCFDPALAARLEELDGIAASRSVARLAAPTFVDAAVGELAAGHA